jgi:hypothetical protein
MRRIAATAALAAVAAVTLPAAPASACSYARPILEVGSTRVAAGATLRVAGEEIMEEDGSYPDCMPALPPTAPASPPPATETEPSAAPSDSSTPLVSLPPLVPVAHVAATRPVEVYLSDRLIATLAPARKAPWKNGLYRFWFSASVTIPADVKPGRYGISAAGDVAFGGAEITVVEGLAATGAPASGLTRLGFLLLLAGAGALAAARRVRRVPG